MPDTSRLRRKVRLPADMKFSELVRLLEQSGFNVIKEKRSLRDYGKPGADDSKFRLAGVSST